MVETEANWDSRSTFLPWMLLWARRAGTEILSCLVCSSQPSTKYFFLARHYFTSFCPYRSDGQAVVLGHLSFNTYSTASHKHETPLNPRICISKHNHKNMYTKNIGCLLYELKNRFCNILSALLRTLTAELYTIR
jgi:hypothetical protein